ncbi:mechanosensitive ion channel domain-containing protein [Luteolibacter marinus]|uniref:mechanosensitive ion channel domain-containing protein n=1 Tax=Luteolibacter marinus TaxID=2776705 RepID=UPI0031BB27D9
MAALAGVTLLACGLVRAEGEEAAIKAAEIEARIEALSTDPAGGEESLKVIETYKRVLELLAETKKATAAAGDYQKKLAGIPAALEELAARNAEPRPEPEMPASVDGSLDDLVRQTEIVKAELAEARKAAQAHLELGKNRLLRQAGLPGMIAKAGADLGEFADAEAPAPSDPELKKAEYLETLARRELLREQTKQYQAELRYSEASPALFSAESAMLARRVAGLNELAELLQARVDARRQMVASDEVERARKDLQDVAGNAEAEAIARERLELAERHGGKDGLSVRMATAAADLANLEESVARVSQQFLGAQQRVNLLEKVNLRIDPATGRLLRSQRQSLPLTRSLRDQLRKAVEKSAQAQIDLIALEDRQSSLLAQTAPAADSAPELSRLWNERMATLRTLIEDHQGYIKTLGATTTAVRSLIDESGAFALFVDKRLLWIPSTTPIGLDEPAIEAKAIKEMFARRPFAPLFRDMRENFWLWLLAGCCVSYLVVRRRTYRAHLKECGQQAVKRNCTSFVPTAKAMLYSIKLAAPIPLAMWFIFLRSGECPVGVAHGIRNVAGFLSGAILLRVLAHPEGVMVDHFRMEAGRCALLRKAFDWFIPTLPLFLFLAIALPLDSEASSAGRLSFIAVVAVFLGLVIHLLRPSKGLLHWHGRIADRFAKTWYIIGLASTIALIAGAAVGYYDSVQGLRIQALMSVGLILVTLWVASMLYRWILVSRRRFAVQQALKRRAAALEERAAKEAEPGAKPQNEPSVEEVKANALKVVEVEEQTNRLVRAAAITAIAFGIFGIWRPAVPALSALDRVTLWTEAAPAEEAKATENPVTNLTRPLTSTSKAAPEAQEDSPGEVTLQDLVTAIIIMLLTFVAARNIPGLLELMFFRHMNLKPGSSFAFTTTIRYLIVVCGLVAAFAQVGITWGKIQWIAAAITLGIGFGLQEIFANFVAGLIILFERPIRLGDIVTIDGIDGKVTQIRIRATTIRQFNSRELIVPNKEFITGQLVNWTLSDNILRVDVPVGIAYGSDTGLARDLLLKVAGENERILADPAPMAVFDNFADSSLAFILRAHVGSVDDLLPARNELHFAIDDAFRKAGIEIAFPQTDIHIRSMPEKPSDSLDDAKP